MILAGKASDPGFSMAALVTLEMFDLQQMSGGVMPVRMGRKVVSIQCMQAVRCIWCR